MRKILGILGLTGLLTLQAQERSTYATDVSAAASDKPNIIIIMVDDMGYSDPGCYGGEINTPNIDKLAENGVRFTQFYNASRCCPTRASLLTGLYPHQVGLTHNGNSLTKNCVTIAEALKEAGYNTGMTGKWHLSKTLARSDRNEQLSWLAHKADYGIFGPLDSYPCNRGFDEHWGIIWGVVNFFDPFSLVHNEEKIETVPDDFYMTNFITEKSVALIDSFSKKDEPFFMYVAHTAPHWPLHALPEDIAKYDGMYDMGWDTLRERRYKKMVELGLVDPETMPNGNNESNRLWQNESNKEWEANHMEVHAAMIDRVDQGIGEIIAKLKETGEYDNTVIFFMSDNGASPERPGAPGYDRPGETREGEKILYRGDNYQVPGPETTMAGIGNAWAGAANTPFRYWKKESFHGGNCTPFIVQWPAGLKAEGGSISKEIGHVKDIMPTCLELANVQYPTNYKGNDIQALRGRSLLDVINGESWQSVDTIYWEHEGGKALRIGDWKIVALKNQPWQLYNLAQDLTETNNLANDYPAKVVEMTDTWHNWAVEMGLEAPIVNTPVELKFYYPFNGNLKDSSQNNFTLESANSYAFSEGYFGAALKLNGFDEYLDLNQEGILNPQNTQFTACAWIKNTSEFAGDNEEVILAQMNGSGDDSGRIYLYSNNDSEGKRFNNFVGGNSNFSSYGSFKTNEWMHVAAVCNPNNKTVTWYVNGEKDITVVSGGAFEACTGGFRIGAHKTGNKNIWEGMIDELYLFAGLLDEAEVQKVMNDQWFLNNSNINISNNNLRVYPNPTRGFISISGIEDDYELKIFDAKGKECAFRKVQNKINITELNKGVYLLKIDMGTTVMTKKLIIE